MAKKKEEEQEKKKKDIYLSADYILDKPDVYVPTLPALDIELGGGIPQGTLCIVASPPKLGKTTLCLQIMKNAQEMGKTVIFVSVEERLKKINLGGVKGLDLSPEKFKLICSKEGEILSAEMFLERAEQALIDFPGCVLCVDSFSSLCPSNEQTNQYLDQTMGGSGKLQARFVRRTAGIINVNRCIVLGIVHLAPNIGSYGGGLTENVGQKMQYGHDIKLRGTKANPFDWFDESKNLIGQRVEWSVHTSALGNRGGSCVGWLKYGIGYAPEMDLISIATDLAIIEKGGSWYTLPDGNKIQGDTNLYNLFLEKPDLYKKIYNQIKEMTK